MALFNIGKRTCKICKALENTKQIKIWGDWTDICVKCYVLVASGLLTLAQLNEYFEKWKNEIEVG